MKHLYCTVAVGEQYLKSALNMAHSLNDLSNEHHLLIATDIETDAIPNTTIDIIPDDKVLFINDCFNYMLKYYPLYKASELNYEYVIFIDSDWRIRPNYNQTKIDNLLKFMDDGQYDVLFERPYWIGHAKTDGRNCIFSHKILFYDLLNTDEYDKGHMCNEQYLVFKNNDKFKIFVDKFKTLYDKSTEANLWPFAEGLEMGMSMVTAKMKWTWDGWDHYLRDMYEFNSKDGGLSVKF
jgi:hypothetical protein